MNVSKLLSTNLRYHGLDLLRAIALLLGLFFHAAIPFSVDEGALKWIVYYNTSNWIFNIVADFIHSFRMPLFFILAGFFSALLLRKYGLRAFIVMRFRKIVIPFVASMIMLTPIMIYQYIAAGFNSQSSEPKAQFHVGQYPVFHLWFLEILIFVTVFIVLIAAINPVACLKNKTGFAYKIILFLSYKSGFTLQYIIFLSILLWLGWCEFPGNQFIQAYSLYQPLQKILYFFLFLSLGWLLYRNNIILAMLQKYSILNMVIGLIAVTVMCIVRYWMFHDPNNPQILMLIIGNFASILAAIHLSIGLFGIFTLDHFRQNAFVDYLVRASYWTYLIHLPIMFFLQVYLQAWLINNVTKYFTTIIITFLMCSLTFSFFEYLKSFFRRSRKAIL